MDSKTFNALNLSELETRAEHLAYQCGKVMQGIGKFPMWNEWLEEEDLYYTEKQRETFWEERLKEAWAAEATSKLTPEQRVEHESIINDLRKQTRELTYKANCASCLFWGQLEEMAEFSADEAFYWRQQIAILERVVAEKKTSEPK